MPQPAIAMPGTAPASTVPDPLAQLRDIHLPEPVSWWPIAPGWWLLLALTLIAVVAAILWWRAYRRRNAWRREALAALDQIDVPTPGPAELQQLNRILRRSLISAGDRRCAQLSGRDWASHLRARGLPLRHDDLLAAAPYRSQLDSEQARFGGELIDASRDWVKRYRHNPETSGQRTA